MQVYHDLMEPFEVCFLTYLFKNFINVKCVESKLTLLDILG
jgi:hypothetical protein